MEVMWMFKAWLKSKTIWLGHFVFTLGVLETNMRFFESYLPDWTKGVSYILIALAIYAARAITTKPLAEK
jgi:hypothetical protein